MLTRADKIFAIAITAALVGALLGASVMALRFWNGMPGDLDPAAITPMIIGVSFSLVVGAVVVGIFLYGRRKEIERDKKL
jgi:hypothetical protein